MNNAFFPQDNSVLFRTNSKKPIAKVFFSVHWRGCYLDLCWSIGLTIFVFMLLLSWLLIPLYLWRQRQFIKRSQARTTQSSEGQTIEAEVISKRERLTVA